MPMKIDVQAGNGGTVKTLTVAGAVLGGIGNTGTAPAQSSFKDDDHVITVKGPSGQLKADHVNVLGVVKDGINNNYTNGAEAPIKVKKEGEVCYKMDADPRGLCYIFNNKTFEGKESRTGTDNDRDELVKLFGKLKFKVKVLDNSDADVMELKLRKLSELSHKEYDCVIVIFLTHGRDGAVQGSDNDWLKISTITSYFKAGVCSSLANKPKLFFFQSCRGNVFQKGAKLEGDGPEGAVKGKELEQLVAPEADFFFGYSTVPGTKSVRNVETGSWYIQELIRAFDGYADKEDLQTLMTRVARGVNGHKFECEDGSYLQQTAESSSRLLKTLYF